MNLRNLLSRFGVTLIFLFAATILVLSLRGVIDSPTSSELLSPAWKDQGPFELSPERGRFALTYSVINNHSTHFSLDLARFTTPDLGYKNGNYVSLFAPGVSYIAMVGYQIGSWFGATQLGAFATISVLALLNSILIYALSRKVYFALLPSILASMTFLFATPAFSYGVNLYQHHVSTFLILSALYLVFFVRGRLSLALVWMLCAMSIPIDYPNVFLMLPIGIFGLTKFVKVKYGKNIIIDFMPSLSVTMLSMLIPLGLFLWFNKVSYDNPFQLSGTVSSIAEIDADGFPAKPKVDFELLDEAYIPPEEQRKSALNFFEARDLINGFYTHLFARDRGIIYFTPVMLLALFGASYFARHHSKLLIVISSVSLSTLLLYSLWGDPWGGWAFGSRYLIPAYAMLSLMLAAYLHHNQKKVLPLLLFLSLSVYSIYVNTAGALGTIAIPPKVQVLHLESITGKVERYSWDRSVEYIKGGSTKSFFYNTFLSESLTPLAYYYILTGAISLVTLIMTITLYLSRREK